VSFTSGSFAKYSIMKPFAFTHHDKAASTSIAIYLRGYESATVLLITAVMPNSVVW